MKTIRYIYKSLLLIPLTLLSVSCGEDFLDLQPPLQVANSDFLETVDDFQAAVLGAYDQMQLADYYGRYFVLVPDIMGEDIKQNASANRGKEWAEYNGAPTTNQSEHREFWAEIYEIVNMANQMINAEFAPPASRQEEFENLLGQAYAIRALGHFDLVRLFAQTYTFTPDASHPGIPVVTEFDPEARPVRNTVAQVYDQIIADFETAIPLLTSDPDNAGTISREAAQALLSRVYLYMGRYTEAAALATEVVNSGRFTLVSQAAYPNQFLEGNSSEAIFEIIFSQLDNPGSDHLGNMYKSSGYGDYLPSQQLFALFEEGDIRATLFADDDNLDGTIYANAEGEGKRVYKYPSEGAIIATDNVPVIRYSEVLLNRAEALAKTGDDAGALADLNMIRERAGVDPLSGLSGQALVDEILLERRRELFAEGHRVFDITRNGQDLVRTDCTSPTCIVEFPDPNFILPLPQEETDVNPNIEQAPGYGT
ncbi:tetratricopeptide (TPR) repeat protein [Catalinimonas alkaloidigena]|uniref:RagB/SusD family nutrient uptake outer membrane protein n=1 Tax=Catalinimonas alkaloidigena TaxID=1075417 RepID=UPI002406C0D3|nr:RagB/SusD family nutrient uptake outer membrane protein [Catalinimonas alkaloidigena]MDF9795421.1 tetratricopeptide (TPR) repeat protein [Catalinimonas alkaloidigena]